MKIFHEIFANFHAKESIKNFDIERLPGKQRQLFQNVGD